MTVFRSSMNQLIGHELVGRNVIAGRWTYQIVEDYDDGYCATFKALQARARGELAGGPRHLFDAEMSWRGRTHGAAGHGARPADADAG
jgi:hypothetical protein